MESRQLRPLVEIVAYGRDRSDHVSEFALRLHAYLTAHLAADWALTIADNGSTDHTFDQARQLATQLPQVRAVRFDQPLGWKDLRGHWSSSTSRVAAFIRIDPATDLERTLAPLIAAQKKPLTTTSGPGGITRRGALVAIGSLGLGAFLTACARSIGGTPVATTAVAGGVTTTAGSVATTAAATAVVDCALNPELTEGPYYLDLDLVRSDLTEDREGAPLTINLKVVQADECTPIADAAVDIWHCDAEGLYSGFVTESQGAGGGGSGSSDSGTFLRGTQISDTNGDVTFQTIYPGWYQGRTVHIHLKVYAGGNEIHTGQIFFDDTFTDGVYASQDIYSARGERTTRNENDGIFGQDGGVTVLAVTAAGDGYSSSLTVGVQR